MSDMDEGWIRFLPGFLRSRLSERYQLQKILGNISWLLLDRVLRMGVGLVVGVWVARYLGPQQFGLYSYAIAFVSLFSAIATLGLDNIVVRDLVNYPDQKNTILGTTFILKLIAGIGTWFLVIIGSYLVHLHDAQVFWIITIIAAGFIFQAWDTIDFWFQSQVQSRYTIYAKSTAFILVSLVKVFLIIGQAPLVAFAWAGLAEVMIGAIGLSLIYWQQGFSVNIINFVSTQTAIQLLKDSMPLILSGFVIMIYMRVDQIMIAQISGDQEVGFYSAAVRVAEIWFFIPMVIVPSVFPNLLKTWQSNQQLFYKKLQSLYNLMAIFSYLIAIPITFLSGFIIQILFGSKYSNSASILSILVWSNLFVNLGVARSSFLTAMNWNQLHFLTVAIGCCINIGCNMVLIPRYGGIGAAIATCISYGFATYFSCAFSPKLLKTGKMLTQAIFYPVRL